MCSEHPAQNSDFFKDVDLNIHEQASKSTRHQGFLSQVLISMKCLNTDRVNAVITSENQCYSAFF